MSKLDILNSYLTERLAVAVREILEAVEATVTEYQQETAQTRIENQTLRQQLRDVLLSEASLRDPVHNACKSVSEETSSCRQEEWSSVLGQQAKLQQKAVQEVQQKLNEEQGQNEGLLREERTPIMNLIPHCKKEVHSEVAALKVNSPTKCLPTVGSQGLILSQDISPQGQSLQDDSQQITDVSLAAVNLQRVKIEPEETEIPISLPGTELPEDSCHTYSPEMSQSTLTNTTLPTDTTDRERLHSAALPELKNCTEQVTAEVQADAIYKCPQCRKSFRELKKLQMHQQSHERAFCCSWCGKGFYQSADLRRHLRTHTGERPFRCTWCSKSFSQRSNLCRHMRIHTGERPYQCALCARGFSDGHTLKKHQRKHYEERYCCSFCEQSFTMARSLQLHLIKQHMIEKANVYTFSKAVRP